MEQMQQLMRYLIALFIFSIIINGAMLIIVMYINDKIRELYKFIDTPNENEIMNRKEILELLAKSNGFCSKMGCPDCEPSFGWCPLRDWAQDQLNVKQGDK